MATIRLVLGLLCITHPLLPGVGISLAVCAIGLGLVVSGLLVRADDEEAHDLDFSR
jgi:hypothetical protein